MYDSAQHEVTDYGVLSEQRITEVVTIIGYAPDYGFAALGVSIANRSQGPAQTQTPTAPVVETPIGEVQIRRFVSGVGGNIRAEPNTSALDIGDLTTELEIIGPDIDGQAVNGDITWYKVQLPEGFGYVHKSITRNLRIEVPIPKHLAPENATIPENARYPELFGSLWNQFMVELPQLDHPIIFRTWMPDISHDPEYDIYLPTSESGMERFMTPFLQHIQSDTRSLWTLRLDDNALLLNHPGIRVTDLKIPGTIELVSVDLQSPINVVVVTKSGNLPRKLAARQIADGVSTYGYFYDGFNTFYVLGNNNARLYPDWKYVNQFSFDFYGGLGNTLAHMIDANNALAPEMTADEVEKSIFITIDRAWNRAAYPFSTTRFSYVFDRILPQIAPSTVRLSQLQPIVTPDVGP